MARIAVTIRRRGRRQIPCHGRCTRSDRGGSRSRRADATFRRVSPPPSRRCTPPPVEPMTHAAKSRPAAARARRRRSAIRLAPHRLHTCWPRAPSTTSRRRRTATARSVPREHLVLYQFSARGHDMAQMHPGLAARPAARRRGRLLSLAADAARRSACRSRTRSAARSARSGGFSDGRDIGVVCNLPGWNGPDGAADVGRRRLPVHAGGGLGAGRRRTIATQLGDAAWDGCIAVALGGEASVATNGFWSALTMATTLELPMLFYIEDNGLGISVKGEHADAGRQHRATTSRRSATSSCATATAATRRRRPR